MDEKPTIKAWNYDEATRQADPQMIEVAQQQVVSSAENSIGDAVARDVQANLDYKTEAEQFGKYPWDRWYSGTLMGVDAKKAVSDFLFLSLYGHSSATDTKRSRGKRAFLRVILTITVVAALDRLGDWLLGR